MSYILFCLWPQRGPDIRFYAEDVETWMLENDTAAS